MSRLWSARRREAAGFALAILIAGGAPAAHALAGPSGEDAATARAFGLLGSWSEDCSRPAGPSNHVVTYAVSPEGGVTQAEGFHPDPGDRVRRLSGLNRIADDQLALVVAYPDGGVLSMVIERKADRYRVLEASEVVDGEKRIYTTGGRMPSGDAPWFNRCAAG